MSSFGVERWTKIYIYCESENCIFLVCYRDIFHYCNKVLNILYLGKEIFHVFWTRSELKGRKAYYGVKYQGFIYLNGRNICEEKFSWKMFSWE